MGKQSKRKARPPAGGVHAAAPPAPASPAPPAPVQPRGWPLWAYATMLLLATITAYAPTYTAGFVRWDDQYYVEENNLLPDADGLKKIWNPLGHDTQQYYPLVFSTYWLEYRLWGLDARWYHIANVALHAVNVLLVLGVALELGVSTPVAAATAAVFALHPAQVASVAWISELKNTLSGMFSLLCVWAYVRHRRTGVWSTYGLCVLAFVGALLSKTQTVTLPGSLLLADWTLQRRGRIRRATLVKLAARFAPMLLLGLVAGTITMRFEEAPWTRTFTVVERLLIITNAAGFYARTFVAPFGLSPIYPEWQVTVADWHWWIAPIVVAGGVLILILGRRRIPDLVTWGMAHFYIALMPVLGLFSFNFQTYTLVADHFLYLSLLGGGLAAALVAEHALNIWPSLRPLVAAAALALLAGYGALTYADCTHWRSNLTFWTRVHERDPDGFLGNFNLGNHYRNVSQWPQAVPFYRRAAEIRPRADYPFIRYAEALGHANGPQAVIDMCTQRLTREPGFYFAYLQRGMNHEQLGHVQEALADYERTLQVAPRGSGPWSEAQYRSTQLSKRQHGGG